MFPICSLLTIGKILSIGFAWQALAEIRAPVSTNIDVGLKARHFDTTRLNFGPFCETTCTTALPYRLKANTDPTACSRAWCIISTRRRRYRRQSVDYKANSERASVRTALALALPLS